MAAVMRAWQYAAGLSLVQRGFSSSRRRSVFVIDGFAAGRIDQMHAAARGTSQRFITLLLRLAGMIGHPALDPQASFGAAIQECRHGLIMQQRPRPQPHSLRAATVRPGPLAHRSNWAA